MWIYIISISKVESFCFEFIVCGLIYTYTVNAIYEQYYKNSFYKI